MKCLDCSFDEGTLLKEFNPDKNYTWYELSEMTEICASCGSENISTVNKYNVLIEIPDTDLLEVDIKEIIKKGLEPIILSKIEKTKITVNEVQNEN